MAHGTIGNGLASGAEADLTRLKGIFRGDVGRCHVAATDVRSRRVALGIVHETWHLRAACRGPESVLFFPPAVGERREDRDVRERKAKAICAACDVREQCLEFALRVREPHGIWGGLTEVERRRRLPRG